MLALGLFTGLGWPLTTLLPLRRRLYGLGAAPVLGFGWLGVVATLLYRGGLPPWSGLLVLLASPIGWAGLVRALRREKEEARPSLALGVSLVGVVLLLLLPSWLGGLQFALFQGNEWDESNYVGSAVAYKLHSYGELDPRAGSAAGEPVANTSSSALRTGFGDFGSRNLDWRPTVVIAYAALDPLLPGLLTTGGYTYRVLMLSLWFGAAAFVLRGLLRAGPKETVLAAVALTVGFFGQYVVDINAWSELGGVPLALTGVGALALVLFPSPAAPAAAWGVAGTVLAIGAPTVFFYPEVLPAYGVAVPVLLVLAWLWRCRSALGARLLWGLIVGCGATLAVCGVFWQGTLGFLHQQITNREMARPDLYLHFQRYLWGLDVGAWHRAGAGTWTPYGLLSAPVDFLSGAFGLYFVVPGPASPLATRVGIKLLLAVFLVALLVQAARSLWNTVREEDRGRGAFLLAAVVSCGTPLGLVLLGRLWQAGKFLSMIAPLLFLGLILPLLVRRGVVARAPALLLVVAQLGFGLARPVVAARAPDGIHYPPPYPSIGQPALKQAISWNLLGWQRFFSNCQLVNLNVRHALIHAYAEMLLAEMRVPWAPSRSTVSYDRERLLAPAEPDRSSLADCQIADSLRRRDRRPGGERLLFVGRGLSRQVPPSLLDGMYPRLIASPVPEGRAHAARGCQAEP